MVLRESALLLYKDREALSKPLHSNQDDLCINLRAFKAVTSFPESPVSILILTGNKSFPLHCDSAIQARDWMRSIWEAGETLRSNPTRRRISALERVNHLTTQISIPKDPYANGASANIYKGMLQRRTKLQREVNVWCRLDHPNIMPLLGITYDFGTSLSMVSPWLRKGTLHAYLESSDARLSHLCPVLVGNLHSMNVTHGDLHSANILISERGHAQLTDFGLSMITPDFEGTSYLTTSAMGGPSGIMYQVLCGEAPFASAASRATSEYCLLSKMANAPNNRG
ncbi:kinase-like domain-containing protein [Mycena albidolilacea]|uniref:Kinase-like domain-containing protein n=1 Tax=Mycena albidolilacea TaxID=1033008 RepID=A0AAD6Z958_9AGAR|nr:kinase-like domain-containing protein [Mycena albidolilacea]